MLFLLVAAEFFPLELSICLADLIIRIF